MTDKEKIEQLEEEIEELKSEINELEETMQERISEALADEMTPLENKIEALEDELVDMEIELQEIDAFEKILYTLPPEKLPGPHLTLLEKFQEVINNYKEMK